MRLTVYTDYVLRVLMYLSIKHGDGDGDLATIEEIALAYGISRNHLVKIVHRLSRQGFVHTVRGRSGGARRARPPGEISIGDVVRQSESDFAVVECHASGSHSNCAVWPACNLRRGFQRAVNAFLRELDAMTLADALATPELAGSLLGVTPPGGHQRAIRISAVPRVGGGTRPH